MITSIVLSKDRACQLQLTLDSIFANLPDCFSINVLYEYSSSDFKEGYEKLIKEWPIDYRVNFVKQNNFKENVLELCNEGHSYICFFTDDDIVYSRIKEFDVDSLFNTHDLGCFSLRLGRNTYMQDPYRKIGVVFPEQGYLSGDMVFWDFTTVNNSPYGKDTNFGYPLSLDGHIFKKEVVVPWMSEIEYDQPNALEARLQKKNDEMPVNMGCFVDSRVVNTPLNLVGSSENMAGEFFGQSLKELNDMYLEGKRIDLSKMDFSNVIGCHQEIELKWL